MDAALERVRKRLQDGLAGWAREWARGSAPVVDVQVDTVGALWTRADAADQAALARIVVGADSAFAPADRIAEIVDMARAARDQEVQAALFGEPDAPTVACAVHIVCEEIGLYAIASVVDERVDGRLDADEYFHLALHAGAAGDHHACLGYLAEVLRRQPMNARALYMRAIQHADLGLTDRAIVTLKCALAIDPGMETACFQLGTLLFDKGQDAEAKQYFASLTGCADLAMRACAEALSALIDGDRQLAREKLTHALSQRSGNLAVNDLMRRMLDKLAP